MVMGDRDLSGEDGGGGRLVEKMVKLGEWEEGEDDGGCCVEELEEMVVEFDGGVWEVEGDGDGLSWR